MLRRAALAAFALLMLSAASVSAATKTVNIVNYQFKPASTTIGLGGKVSWQNATSATTHTTTADLFGRWNKTVAPGATKSVTFNVAGTFAFHCAIHPFMTGKVAVGLTVSPKTGTTNDLFHVRWAISDASGSFVYDVQRRKAGGAWQNWLTGVNQAEAFYQPPSTGTWQFRSRLRQTGGSATPYSPVLSISVT